MYDMIMIVLGVMGHDLLNYWGVYMLVVGVNDVNVDCVIGLIDDWVEQLGGL